MLGVGVKEDGVKRVLRELTDGISTIEFETVDIGWKYRKTDDQEQLELR